MASGASISAIYKERTKKSLSAKEIASLARQNDPDALLVWKEAGYYIGKAVSYAVNLLGIDTIVLGGGAASGFDLLCETAESAINEYTFSAAVPTKVKLLHSNLGAFAALIGCAALGEVE